MPYMEREGEMMEMGGREDVDWTKRRWRWAGERVEMGERDDGDWRD